MVQAGMREIAANVIVHYKASASVVLLCLLILIIMVLILYVEFLYFIC
jgi:hypothetical protein